MKTDVKIMSSFLAAAVWADGEYNEEEQDFVKDLSEGMEMPGLTEVLEQEIKSIENMDEEKLNDYLKVAAKKVDKDEVEGILSLCLQLMCADAFLAQDEMDNFFAFAEILGVDDDAAQNILDEFVDEEEDLIIEEE